jgi:hypothetical protein
MAMPILAAPAPSRGTPPCADAENEGVGATTFGDADVVALARSGFVLAGRGGHRRLGMRNQALDRRCDDADRQARSDKDRQSGSSVHRRTLRLARTPGLACAGATVLPRRAEEGQPIISAVDVELTGTFNLSASEERWKPFTSRQRVVTRGPGFLWDADIAMLPGVRVRVHDAYIAGEGRLHAAVLGLFSMAMSTARARSPVASSCASLPKHRGTRPRCSEPRRALGGRRRSVGERHPCGRTDRADVALWFQ